MFEQIPGPTLLTAFVLTAILLAVTPGPGVLYIVTRSLVQGRRSGMASVLGVALGNLGNAIGASLGLAALFAVSSLAFILVKYVGAAYLIYLGIQALRAPARRDRLESVNRRNHGRVFRDGFVVALMNPKTTLFFAAFLPQFMNPAGSYIIQSLWLGGLFVFIAALSDSAYALAAGTLGKKISRDGAFKRLGRYLSGGAFIGLGLFTAFSGFNQPN